MRRVAVVRRLWASGECFAMKPSGMNCCRTTGGFSTEKCIASKGTPGKDRGRIDPARAERAMVNGGGGGKLPLSDVLRSRVRYFTAGTAIGSDDFFSNIGGQWRDRYGLERRRNAYSMRYADWGGLRSFRNLQVDPIELPSLN